MSDEFFKETFDGRHAFWITHIIEPVIFSLVPKIIKIVLLKNHHAFSLVLKHTS
jgi:hypothetical protein